MCSGIIEMRPAELTWLHTVLGLQRPVMTPNLIISVKRCWSWDFSMIHASTKQQLSKGVLGKNLLPGVGKFFWPPSLTIHTHTHTHHLLPYMVILHMDFPFWDIMQPRTSFHWQLGSLVHQYAQSWFKQSEWKQLNRIQFTTFSVRNFHGLTSFGWSGPN